MRKQHLETDRAVALTEDQLAAEGGSMGDLLGRFRNGISPALIGEPQWERILECAGKLPITLGALPFGFELPLHTREPEADFGVSLASGTRSAAHIEKLARANRTDRAAGAVTRLCGKIDAEKSSLREIVGRKLMLEYDIGSAPTGASPLPGLFLIPRGRPIIAAGGRGRDAGAVIDALVTSVGWESDDAEREIVERIYLAQPENTRIESLGVFPSRPRAIRLAVMGFKCRRTLAAWLESIGWRGRTATVESMIARFDKHVEIVEIGANIDALREGVGAKLGLTLVPREGRGKDSEYWLDGRTDWNPLLQALRRERLATPEKTAALADWKSIPAPLFAKSGTYMLLRGIHHLKLVAAGNRLRQAKAYVFMALSSAPTPTNRSSKGPPRPLRVARR